LVDVLLSGTEGLVSVHVLRECSVLEVLSHDSLPKGHTLTMSHLIIVLLVKTVLACDFVGNSISWGSTLEMPSEVAWVRIHQQLRYFRVAFQQANRFYKSILQFCQLVLLNCVVDAWVSRQRSSKLLNWALPLEQFSCILIESIHAQHLIYDLWLVLEIALFDELHYVLQFIFAVDDSLLQQ